MGACLWVFFCSTHTKRDTPAAGVSMSTRSSLGFPRGTLQEHPTTGTHAPTHNHVLARAPETGASVSSMVARQCNHLLQSTMCSDSCRDIWSKDVRRSLTMCETCPANLSTSIEEDGIPCESA